MLKHLWTRRLNISPCSWLIRRGVCQFASKGQLYQNMLDGYKKSMKKPSPLYQEVELEFWEGFLLPTASLSSLQDSIQYIVQLRNCKLFSVAALDIICSYLSEVNPRLSKEQQILGNCFLAQQGRPQLPLSPHYRNPDQLAPVLEVYCSFLLNSSLTCGKGNPESLLQMLGMRKWEQWHKEIGYVHRALLATSQQFFVPPGRTYDLVKKRSNLEIEVEALLKTLGHSYEREVSVMGFTVDFLVTVESSSGPVQCVLQVMGFPHFTVEGKLFGRDCLRCLIIQQQYPVGIINAETLNPIRELQGRLSLVEGALKSALGIKGG